MKKEAVKKVGKVVKSLTGDAAKRARARKIAAKKLADKRKKEKADAARNRALDQIMKEGQRQYDPSSGMVMNKGGIVKKSNKKK